MSHPKQRRYRSYLFRCWAETDASGDVILWRFSWQDLDSGQRRGFANLTELVIALQDELIEHQAQEAL